MSNELAHNKNIAIVLILVWVAFVPFIYLSGLGLKLNFLIFVLLLVVSFFINSKSEMPSMITNSQIVIGTIVLTVFITFGIDRGIGLTIYKNDGIIFLPWVQGQITTTEFDFKISTNNWGFRGPNIDVEYDGDCRIAIVGDSFTYGWGVNFDDTWGSVLEGNLQDAGIDAQVLNFGRGGAGPADYVRIAENGIPVFKPDVVIVSFLQADDINQALIPPSEYPVYPYGHTESNQDTFVAKNYPNIIEYLNSDFSADNVNKQWRAQIAQRIESFTPEQLARYTNDIPQDIRELFETGNINPGIFYALVLIPDHWSKTMQLNNPDIVERIEQLSVYIGDISKIVTEGDLIISSMPYGIFVSEPQRQAFEYMGWNVPDEMLSTNSMDDALQLAIDMAGVDTELFTSTELFRSSTDVLFYSWDGHLNVNGNKLYANSLTPLLIEKCR